MVKYKDAEGKTRFYEPTDRKNEIIRKREEGKAAKGDANDYRNTPEYEKTVKREMSVRETVKRDIDTLLPSCRSYEEMLLRLRELGYRIKDKKVDGTWLSHVTFQPPGARKGVRDNSLGDGLRYTRIVLTAELKERGERIWREEQANGRPRGEDARNTVPPFIPYFDEYEYGKTDLLAIDDTYRSVRREDGGFDIVERSEQERKVLSDIRETDREIKGLIDTTELHRMVAEVEAQRKKKKPYLTKTEEQRLLVQLQQSFECLRYTEKHGVYSYGQMLDMYKANRNTFNNITENLEQVKKLLATMQTVSHAPMMVERITARMEKFKDDEVYLLDKYHDDKEQLARWRSLIAKHGLTTEQGQAAYAEKINGYAERIAELEEVVAKAAEQMAEIENCVYTYDRIDRKHGISNADFMERFERVKAGLEEPLMDEEDLLRSDLEEEQEEEYEPERSEEYRERER